jgi:hypothetical protein
MAGYSPSIGGSFQGGAPASSGGNVTTENREVVSNQARTSSSVLHIAIGAIVVAVLILAFGRGFLRNARIA